MGQSATLTKNLYGNIAVYSPANIFMFYTNQHKLDFYLKKNLVNKISDTEYRLNFEPKGLGYSDSNSYINLEIMYIRENRCVVTGVTENLNRHHIVPTFFRKHFPLEYKCSYLLVVIINIDTHNEYTKIEKKFYDELAEKYGSPKLNMFAPSLNKRAKGIAHALRTHIDNIPKEQVPILHEEFTHLTKLEPTDVNFKIYCQPTEKTIGNDFGMALMSKVTDYDEFERIWLNHFIETMNPKFLPEDLKSKYKI